MVYFFVPLEGRMQLSRRRGPAQSLCCAGLRSCDVSQNARDSGGPWETESLFAMFYR